MRTADQDWNFRAAIKRVERDPEYRAYVIESGRIAQFEAHLTDKQWHSLLPVALAVDAAARLDPFTPTEIDQGEADAAGVKG